MKKTEKLFNDYIETHKDYIEVCNIYNETRGAIDKLCKDIWSYICENYAEYLEYGKYSALDEWDLDDTHLSIEYYRTYYDLHESTLFYIPLSVIYNDTWKEFIDKHFDKIKLEIKAEEELREVDEREKRRKLYEKLKQEFEKQDNNKK